MQSITRKPILKSQVEASFEVYQSEGLEAFTSEIVNRILTAKVKFPLLEYAAELIVGLLPGEIQIEFCDQLVKHKTMGGNVVLGKILQSRLATHYEESIAKAMEYIIHGDEWYVCDIIGERVFGVALLTSPTLAIESLKKLSSHSNKWVIRSVGPGIHYATKKGLAIEVSRKVFPILLNLSSTKELHIKKGIGWAAKTTARFHPSLIEEFHSDINDDATVGQWFKTKIKIGLERNQYAQNNNS